MEKLGQRETGIMSRYGGSRPVPSISRWWLASRAVGRYRTPTVAAAGAIWWTSSFVREYTGAPLKEDRKSVTYRLTVGATDRTLSSEEVAAIRKRVIDAMRASGYELRV